VRSGKTARAFKTGGMGRPAEIEFAVRLGQGDEPHDFGFLQMRPLAVTSGFDDQHLDAIPEERLICASPMALGNGSVELSDLVMVDFERFERSASPTVARDIARYNAELNRAGAPVPPDRRRPLGLGDPSLGIPVAWEQIAGARVIVESGFRDFA